MAYERSGNTAPAPQPKPSPSYPPRYIEHYDMRNGSTHRAPVVRLVFWIFICFALVSMVILSRVQQLQISNEITTLTREYSDLQAENVRMQSELAGKASNKNIQEFAETQLGMYPLNTSQVEYVQIQTNDVVSIPEAEQNVFVRIKGWFDSILDYLRG